MTELIAFDPNGLAQKDSNIFGLPFSVETAQQVIIAVPWEVTVSYNAGTALGPAAIYAASKQVDLYEPDLPDAWRFGLAMDDIPSEIERWNQSARMDAESYIEFLENGGDISTQPSMADVLAGLNELCQKMNNWVQERAAHFLDRGKLIALVGGDHSTPLGVIRELGLRHKDFGILHIDAHADLRDAYEGFTYSHASIMFNALKVESLSKLVQIGIRDYCQAEAELVSNSEGRIISFYDRDLKERMYEGKSWREICRQVIDCLPEKVYLSFDIDGLDPRFCPHTGTPVPGGLDADQATYLVKLLVESGRRLIGFDVNEVAPGKDEWDANVAARLLYRLANLAAKSNRLQPIV